MQQWYALADEALEDATHDSRAMRAFIDGDIVPDATTLLGFYHQEPHSLAKTKTQMHALVEHSFHVLKNLSDHRLTRYKGLAKNTAQLHMLFALVNLVSVGCTLHTEARR